MIALIIAQLLVFPGALKSVAVSNPTIAIVQDSIFSSSANATTVTGNLRLPTSAGSVLVVGCINGGTRTVSSIADDIPNSYAFLPDTKAINGVMETEIWQCLAPTSGVTFIQITFSGSAGTFAKEFHVWEVSGFTTPVFEQGGFVSATGVGTTNTGPYVSTGYKNAFIASVVVSAGSITQNPKAGNVFTSGGYVSSNGDAGCSYISSAPAKYFPEWLNTGSGVAFCSSIVSIRQ